MNSGDADVVVIGAGVGGLAAAARLAHAGLDVTVLEARAYPGGKMRTLPSDAGPVDAGPTVLTLRPVFDALFAECGSALDDHVSLVREPVLARHFWQDGSTLDLHADPAASEAAIADFAGPAEADAYRAFRRDARTLFEAFDGPLMQAARPSPAAIAAMVARRPSLLAAMAPWRSLAGSLRRRFADPRLRQLFGRYATYVGGSPYASPALLSLISHAEAAGVWRVEGGMARLAEATANLARRSGARLVYETEVRRIETAGGRVSAVRDTEGRRHPCACAVFNGDPRALVGGRLGGPARTATTHAACEPRSLSAEVWAFAARAEGPELSHHNVFFGADPRAEFGPIARGAPGDDPTIYVCAQDRGTGLAPPPLERFETIANAAPLPHAHPEEPLSCRIRTFAALANHRLTFTPEPADAAMTTPWGFERLFPESRGSLYGRSPHGLMAAFRRPTARTRLPGLFLAGGGAHPGAGVPMATLSGRHAAEAILTDRNSASRSRQAATPGGTSTGSRRTADAPSASSDS